MSSRYFFAVLISALLMPDSCLAEKIYKWVDAQGNTHYSQQNPADRNTTPVDVSPNTAAHGQTPPDPSMENIKRMARELEERDKKERAAWKKEVDAKDKRLALERENKRRQKELDDKAIAECRKQRYSYCDDTERVLAESRKKKKHSSAGR